MDTNHYRRCCFLLMLLIVRVTFAKVFTFDELMDAALQNSKELQRVHMEMKIVEEMIREIYGSVIPQIKASVGMDHAYTQSVPYLLMNDLR